MFTICVATVGMIVLLATGGSSTTIAPIQGVERGAIPLLIDKPPETYDEQHDRVILADPSAYHGSGPYRALYSVHPDTAIQAAVKVPCAAGHFNPGEMGYIYLGGWGASTTGFAVDAGLQKGSNVSGDPRVDVYHLIMNYQGKPWAEPSPNYLFACGQVVTLTFQSDTDGLLRLSGSGLVVVPGNGTATMEPAVETVTMAPRWSDGWDPKKSYPQNGPLVKRMVTIGQPPCWFERNTTGRGWQAKQPGWDQDGAYFGHVAGDITPLIQWSKSRVGHFDKNLGLWKWVPIQSSSVQRVDSYPDDRSRVKTNGDDTGDEAVAIDLHPNPGTHPVIPTPCPLDHG